MSAAAAELERLQEICDQVPALEPMMFAQTPDEIRFFSKCRLEGTCWLWTASVDQKGYGHFRLAGRIERAHKVVYVWFFGADAIPEGHTIDHLCRRRNCVNPLHLEAVPHVVNVRRGLTGLYPHGHRTHCNHGHPFDEENTATRNDCGGRVCRTCAREACARYRASHLEERRRKDREYKRLLAARAT